MLDDGRDILFQQSNISLQNCDDDVTYFAHSKIWYFLRLLCSFVYYGSLLEMTKTQSIH